MGEFLEPSAPAVELFDAMQLNSMEMTAIKRTDQ